MTERKAASRELESERQIRHQRVSADLTKRLVDWREAHDLGDAEAVAIVLDEVSRIARRAASDERRRGR